MAENLETKAHRATLRMERILRDLCLKVTHVIEYKLDYYNMPKGIGYDIDFEESY